MSALPMQDNKNNPFGDALSKLLWGRLPVTNQEPTNYSNTTALTSSNIKYIMFGIAAVTIATLLIVSKK